jgi:hypothetical protein
MAYVSKTCSLNYVKCVVRTNFPHLNQQHRIAYGTLMEVMNSGYGRIYFLDAPGVTGKTFLIYLLFARIRSLNEVVLVLA